MELQDLVRVPQFPQLSVWVSPVLQTAPHATEQVDEHDSPEQVNGLQVAWFTHCQSLVQAAEPPAVPSHLYWSCPLEQVPVHL